MFETQADVSIMMTGGENPENPGALNPILHNVDQIGNTQLGQGRGLRC